MTAAERRTIRRKERNKDIRSLAFMEWVKELPCVCCRVSVWRAWIEEDFARSVFTHLRLLGARDGWSIAAHIGGNFAAKASNWHTIPLCHRHHDSGAPDCEHVLKGAFAEHWQIAIDLINTALRCEFDVLFPEQT